MQRWDLETERQDVLAGAAHAAGIGAFSWELRTGELVWDAPLLDVFGYDETTFDATMASFERRVHPEDLPRVNAALRAAIETRGDYHADFRVVRPDGSVRWLTARGQAQGGDVAERVIGACTDTTLLREGAARLQRTLESMAVGYLQLDTDWRIGYVNAEGRRVLGAVGELVGHVLWELFPATVGTQYETNYRRAVQTRQTVSFDAYYPAPLDAWFEMRAVPTDDGLSLYFLDVTARRLAQEASDREARRSALLAAVATALAENPDPTAALLAVCQVLVPALGDWAIASLVADGSSNWRHRLTDVTSWHEDPGQREVLAAYRGLRVTALTDSSPVAVALVSAAPASTDRSGLSRPGVLLADGPAHRLLTQLNPFATVVLPLRGRGHTRGLLTVVNGVGRGAFSAAEITALREVTGAVGLALDNAHLIAVQRDYSERLQRSLLAELPEPDHLELVARYVPAADGAQVGGDWYDAFMVHDGATCMVIGDVTGHDQDAAVQMAQVRNVLRGIAHSLPGTPAEVLRALDSAMHDLAIGALTTAVLARVEQDAVDASRGLRTIRWSSAGHLPPLLLDPLLFGTEGSAEFLDRPSDLLLGLDADFERHDHTAHLRTGSTILFYTDGLVERRGENLEVGLARLRATAARFAALPLQEFCDALLRELAVDSEDDVALLALRAHDESRPRPPEAGPELLADDLLAPDRPRTVSSHLLS
ncbi:MAG: SpoIIE family protein phosphatase [Janthinobacterium lividum]